MHLEQGSRNGEIGNLKDRETGEGERREVSNSNKEGKKFEGK